MAKETRHLSNSQLKYILEHSELSNIRLGEMFSVKPTLIANYKARMKKAGLPIKKIVNDLILEVRDNDLIGFTEQERKDLVIDNLCRYYSGIMEWEEVMLRCKLKYSLTVQAILTASMKEYQKVRGNKEETNRFIEFVADQVLAEYHFD